MPTVLNTSRHIASPIAPTSTPRKRTLQLEIGLAIACLVLLAVGAWGPSVDQPDHYHAFADQRRLLGVPNWMDVLSNLAFAGFGMVGLRRVRQIPPDRLSRVQHNLAQLFFFGLVATALLSGWYHLQPDNEGLALDRYGMTIAFAGLLGLTTSTRVSERAGQWLALAVLVCGAWSIQTWSALGNVLPWAILQYGGMALILGLASMPPRMGALSVSWLTVLLIYTLAKLLEHADQSVFEFTHGLVSGHTLKHLVASCAALPVLAAIRRANRLQESSACDATVAAKR